MPPRERRPWQAYEDELLRAAVAKEDPSDNPSKWYAIAKHVPNRTNKDCRKRWFAKMASDVTKGGWSPDEDERLMKAIDKYGTRWSLVSAMVQTRNSDQCSKRWCDTLDPSIDRTSWTPESDKLLMEAVKEHGKVWTKIVKTYFPGRTGLAAKNRYNSITRFSAGSSRSSTPLSQRKTAQESPLRFVSDGQSASSSPSPPPQIDYQAHLHAAHPITFDFQDSDSYSTPSPYSTGSMPLQPMPEDGMFFSPYTYDPNQQYTYPLPSPAGVPFITKRTVSAPNIVQSNDVPYYKQQRENALYLEQDFYDPNQHSYDPVAHW